MKMKPLKLRRSKMMKLSHFKLLLIAHSLILTSCGYGLKEVYNGIPYNSSVFSENYYKVWDKRINPFVSGNSINETKEEYELTEENDNVFISIQDNTFKECDDKWATYDYEHDREYDDMPEGAVMYGPTVAMINLDNSFRYGVVSKLFDGQMFCNGDFQRSRTQVEPTNENEGNGFGALLSKECAEAKYFMMNFKCAVVKANGDTVDSNRLSELELKIGFYLKNTNGYTYVPLTYHIDDVPTNSGDSHTSSSYRCFGFSLENIPHERLIGFSIQYEKISDNYSETHPEEETLHAMMLYEVSFPYSTWH